MIPKTPPFWEGNLLWKHLLWWLTYYLRKSYFPSITNIQKEKKIVNNCIKISFHGLHYDDLSCYSDYVFLF